MVILLPRRSRHRGLGRRPSNQNPGREGSHRGRRNPTPRHRFSYSPSERTGADHAATYLTRKKPHLDYQTALANRWPIATGIIEGACRHLVTDRMDITGARWGLHGAQAILTLRTLSSNGDFDTYWHHHLDQEHHRVHHARYRDNYQLAA